jgi:hypothetical protein
MDNMNMRDNGNMTTIMETAPRMRRSKRYHESFQVLDGKALASKSVNTVSEEPSFSRASVKREREE